VIYAARSDADAQGALLMQRLPKVAIEMSLPDGARGSTPAARRWSLSLMMIVEPDSTLACSRLIFPA
jgi:hypothetical protein